MKEQIINQGAAGCIYQYGFDCKGNKINTQKYITKIQRNEKLSNNEYDIGKKIKEITNYKDYFAPVIECCGVNLAKYNSEEIDKCEFIKKHEKVQGIKERTYHMCKIEYIGERTLGEHIFDVFRYTPMQHVKTLVNTYVYLLKSLKILSDNNIVHYDIKENNIVCNNVNTPIIIDFGRSIDITLTKTDPAKYKDVFFLYEPDFDYWCLDINFLMYIFNELGEGWGEQLATKEIIMGVIDDFFTQTRIAKNVEKTRHYKAKQVEYYMKFEGKKWLDVFQELIKFMKTWDNYALAVTYADFIIQLKEETLLAEFNTMLLDIIASTPDERPTVEQTIEISLNIFAGKIKRDEMKKLNNIVKQMSKNDKTVNDMLVKLQHSRISDLRKDELMNKKYGL